MAIPAVAAMTMTAYQVGAGESDGGSTGNTESHALSKAINPSVIVMKFSQAKLPEITSQNCVAITISPATPATGCGTNRNHGTISCAKWLAATSTRCSGPGRRWKYQLNGPGIGWVSW